LDVELASLRIEAVIPDLVIVALSTGCVSDRQFLKGANKSRREKIGDRTRC
jgi:hypothetical protein